MTNESVIKKLQDLFDRYKSGWISKEEHERLRAEILGLPQEPFSGTEKENREPGPLLNEDFFEEPKGSLKNRNGNVEKNVENDFLKSNRQEKSRKIGGRNFINLFIGFVFLASLVFCFFYLFNPKPDDALINNEGSSENILENHDLFDFEVYGTQGDENGSFLNVRAAPDPESLVLFILQDGDLVRILEHGLEKNSQWIKIQSHGNKATGFIYGKYIREVGTKKIEDTVVTEDDIDTEEAKNEVIDIQSFQGKDLELFLRAFFAVYFSKDNDLRSTLYPGMGVFLLDNQGTICNGNKSNKVRLLDLGMNYSNIFNLIPSGDLCNGFPGANDGIYYSSISQLDLPAFSIIENNGDKIDVKVSTPQDFGYGYVSDIQKAMLIKNNELVGVFYFVRVEGEWYIICQDFCECLQ